MAKRSKKRATISSVEFLKKGVVDSTDERNMMMNIMTSPEGSQWRKWVGLVCRCSRSTSYGHDGKQGNR